MSAVEREYLYQWLVHRDPGAFRELVVGHAGMVFATCKRILRDAAEAEDVSQECFEALAELRRMPRSRSAGAWLHGVATKRSLQRIRSEHRRKAREIRYAEDVAGGAEATWDDIYEYIDEAIAELPDKLRLPIVHHYLEGRSKSDIAERSGVSRGTVNNRIEQGLDRMRVKLKRLGLSVTGGALAAMLGANAAGAAPQALAQTLGKLALALDVGAGPATAGGRVAAMLSAAGGVGLAGRAAMAAVSLTLMAALLPFMLAGKPGAGSQPAGAEAVDLARAGSGQNTETTPGEAALAAPAGAGAVAFAAPLSTEEPAPEVSPALHTPYISGRVLDPDDRATGPAYVFLVDEQDLRANTRLTTEDGHYFFEALAPGRTYVVVASHESYGSAMSGQIAVAENGGASGIDLHLGLGHRVLGRVTDNAGRPVFNARVVPTVTFTSAGSARGATSKTISYGLPVKTNAKGEFSLTHIGPVALSVYVKAAGYRMAGRPAVTLTMPEDRDYTGLDLQVTPTSPGFVRGAVHGEDGAPLEGINVYANPLLSSSGARGFARTGRNGAYAIEDLGGSDELWVTAEGAGFVMESLLAPVNSSEADFVLLRAGTVTGHVVDAATGAPVVQFDARIGTEFDTGRGLFLNAVDSWKTFSSPDGEFSFGGAAPPAVQLSVRAKGFARSTTEFTDLAPGTTAGGVKIRLAPGAVISGQVTDAKGMPLSGAEVYTIDTDVFSPSPAGFSSTTDEHGQFVLEGMSPGSSHAVAARAEGYAVGIGWEVTAEIRPAANTIFALVKEGRLSGVVSDGSEPAPNLMVVARGVSTGTYGVFTGAVTTDRGKFAISGLPAGEYWVSARQSEAPHLRWEKWTRVGEGAETELQFDAPADPNGTARLAGILAAGAAGDTPRNYLVSVRREGDEAVAVTNVLEDGAFEFDFLPPGTYHILAHPYNDPSQAVAEANVTLEADGEAEVHLVVE